MAKRGRPKTSKKDQRKVRLGFYATGDEAERIKRFAATTNHGSVTDWIRFAVLELAK